MKRAIAMVVLAVLGATLVAGCGGGSKAKPLSKADYTTQVTKVGASLTTSLSTLGSVTTAKSAATALAKVQTDLATAADTLDSITPPEDVKTQHEALSKAIREFSTELGPVITKLQAGNLQALTSVTSLKGVKDIQSAATAITQAGYKING
ncbi:MAG: hypothetical protein WCH31_07775 [Actinomycetes bacterium]